MKEEGEKIRSLAKEAEKMKLQMREEQLKERKMMTKDLLEEIENRKKMRLVERIRDEVNVCSAFKINDGSKNL